MAFDVNPGRGGDSVERELPHTSGVHVREGWRRPGGVWICSGGHGSPCTPVRRSADGCVTAG